MKSKKWLHRLGLLMLLVMVISGCTTGQDTDNESTGDDVYGDDSQTSTSEEQEPSDDVAAEETNTLTAQEVAYLMGNGTNLGNTMEAYGRSSFGIDGSVSDYETAWGQPVTTGEMLQEMKNSGFDSIRIPVAWTNTMDYENGDYTIREDYLDRVEEIVNYALDADMYVIVNDHWDGGWWGMFGSETAETRQKAMDMYVAIWTQVGERFKDYSYKLILESGNEELGNRLNDMDVARDSGSLSMDECYETANTINQTFVDTIRGQGSKNADRFLLIAGYNTDIDMTYDDRFQMPTDTSPEKLLLSVHYYTPWSYCGTDSVASWGSEKHYNEQNDLLKKMTKFTDQGYAIVFGEYAALPKSDGTIKNNTVDFTRNFLDNCDLYGYVPMLWDCSSFFIRKDLTIHDEGLKTLFAERSFEAQVGMSEDMVKDAAQASMDAALALAIENDKTATGPSLNGDENAVAWIMYSSVDYGVTYSVGDTYDPLLMTEGVIPTDVLIEEAGTYTIGLDFTGTAAGYGDSISFSAIGISNGELLFPDYLISIKEVLINGEPYKLTGIPYTTADDEICTRVNLYNGWVTDIDIDEARFANPNMANFLSAAILDPAEIGEIQTLEITFDYGPAN